MITTKLKLAVLATGVIASAGSVQASITGYLWDSSVSGLSDSSENVPTSPPASAASVIFSVPNGGLNFNSGNAGNGYTIGGFLATGGATITGGTLGTADSGGDLDNILIQLIGQVSVVNGQQYNVEHDDGVILTIGGVTLVNEPGPTAAVTTDYTWTGATGTYDFNLLYAEVAGPPAVLITDLPLTQVPEPTTTALAGAMVLLPFGMRALRTWRKRQRA